MKKKIIEILVCMLFVATTVLPVAETVCVSKKKFNDNLILKTINTDIVASDDGTEYWALLVAVGVYAGHPEYNLPITLEEVENMYNMLLISNHWMASHIRLITGENATALNIIKGLRWLDKMDDEDDMCLVYFSTHGGPGLDLPPFDEKDRHDEYLETYLSFKYPIPFIKIWDDELNLLLSLLDSRGICVVIDSCHSGGFDDPPYIRNNEIDYRKGIKDRRTTHGWMQEFAEDISGEGRVVLMSCTEDEISLAALFSMFLVDGLQGFADKNGDDNCSAEEAFEFAETWIVNITEGLSHPMIYDGYTGEFFLTKVELPPSTPLTPVGPTIGKTNTTYTYSTSSTDPEGDRIRYFVDWGDGTSDWTSLYQSGGSVNLSHSWTREGTYNVWVKAQDEHGAGHKGWSGILVVTMTDTSILDQRQTKWSGGKDITNTRWLAQSFQPSLDMLSKIELGLFIYDVPWEPDYPIYVSIRHDLQGDDLAEISLTVEPGETMNWVDFDFPDIETTPGETYYILCKRYEGGEYGYVWIYGGDEPYPNGSSYYSSNQGNTWHEEYTDDFCFVTYG